MDNYPTYRLLKKRQIRAFIDLNDKCGRPKSIPDSITIDKDGTPLCQEKLRMKPNGYDKSSGSLMWRCPMERSTVPNAKTAVRIPNMAESSRPGPNGTSAEKFIALVDKYENFDNLTTTMLNEFVEKILVHERDRKGSIETTQEVEIYFNFVGRYIPPHFGEVNLTPEELEALRKKEERKDKLHQAYLRRKANGTQKRYEDKIKAKKKAEIEAKKAAIRAEDMKNGVFIPASSLPKKEPQKAPMPARAAM